VTYDIRCETVGYKLDTGCAVLLRPKNIHFFFLTLNLFCIILYFVFALLDLFTRATTSATRAGTKAANSKVD
jgi:hypothetical protein